MPDSNSQPQNALPSTARLVNPAQPETEYPRNPLIRRRVEALSEAYPTIPLPVAIAMVERASQEQWGIVLTRLEEVLDELNRVEDFEKLPSSHLRLLDVTLCQIDSRISDLRAKLQINPEKR